MKCTANKHRSTEPCDREAVDGLTVCQVHGALAPQVAAKAELVRAKRELDGLVHPIPMDDPLADPAYALHADYRRTVGRIQFLEGKIADLSAEELIWGKTKEEQVGASEFTGINTTYESRVHVYERLLAAERDHLLKVTDAMSKQHFRAMEAALQARSITLVYDLLVAVLPALGHDPNNSEVRRTVAGVLTHRLAERGGHES